MSRAIHNLSRNRDLRNSLNKNATCDDLFRQNMQKTAECEATAKEGRHYTEDELREWADEDKAKALKALSRMKKTK